MCSNAPFSYHLPSRPQGGVHRAAGDGKLSPCPWEASHDFCNPFSEKNIKLSPEGTSPAHTAPGSLLRSLKTDLTLAKGQEGWPQRGPAPKSAKRKDDLPASGSGRVLACEQQQLGLVDLKQMIVYWKSMEGRWKEWTEEWGGGQDWAWRDRREGRAANPS